jgi:hypothetical protein
MIKVTYSKMEKAETATHVYPMDADTFRTIFYNICMKRGFQGIMYKIEEL